MKTDGDLEARVIVHSSEPASRHLIDTIVTTSWISLPASAAACRGRIRLTGARGFRGELLEQGRSAIVVNEAGFAAAAKPGALGLDGVFVCCA